MTKFGDAQIKAEGQMLAFDIGDMNVSFPVQEQFKNPETTYVERRVPVELEDKAHELIDQFLKDHGYDPEEI